MPSITVGLLTLGLVFFDNSRREIDNRKNYVSSRKPFHPVGARTTGSHSKGPAGSSSGNGFGTPPASTVWWHDAQQGRLSRCRRAQRCRIGGPAPEFSRRGTKHGRA